MSRPDLNPNPMTITKHLLVRFPDPVAGGSGLGNLTKQIHVEWIRYGNTHKVWTKSSNVKA